MRAKHGCAGADCKRPLAKGAELMHEGNPYCAVPCHGKASGLVGMRAGGGATGSGSAGISMQTLRSLSPNPLTPLRKAAAELRTPLRRAAAELRTKSFSLRSAGAWQLSTCSPHTFGSYGPLGLYIFGRGNSKELGVLVGTRGKALVDPLCSYHTI